MLRPAIGCRDSAAPAWRTNRKSREGRYQSAESFANLNHRRRIGYILRGRTPMHILAESLVHRADRVCSTTGITGEPTTSVRRRSNSMSMYSTFACAEISSAAAAGMIPSRASTRASAASIIKINRDARLIEEDLPHRLGAEKVSQNHRVEGGRGHRGTPASDVEENGLVPPAEITSKRSVRCDVLVHVAIIVARRSRGGGIPARRRSR